MAYNPYDRKPSGIVFFGNNSTDQLYESVSDFIYNTGTSTLQAPNITASSALRGNNLVVANNGTIGSTDTTNAITISSDGSVSILKNLTINGTTTTVNSTSLVLQDPIIVLGSGSPTLDDNKDRGIAFNYYDGSAKTGFFGYDDSAGKFLFVPDATITNEVVSGASGTLVANLQGNADTATKWASTINLQLTDQVTGSGNFDGSANANFAVQLTASAINGQTETSIANNTDYLLIASGTSLRKISKSNFATDLGAMSSFSIVDLQNDTATINNTNKVLFSGVANNARIKLDVSTNGSTTGVVFADLVSNSISETYLTTSVAGSGLSGGNGVPLAIDISEFSDVSIASGDSLLTLDSDGATEQRTTISNLGSYLAGTNLTAGNDGKLSISNTAIESAVFTAGNFVDSSTIDFTVTAGDSVTASVIDGSITNTKLRNSAALSVIGRDANSTGAPADITAGTDGHVLRRSGTTLGFGLLTNTNIDSTAAINFSKLENGTALSVLGRSANSNGAVASITAGTDGHVLRRSGTTVDFGTIVSAGIADGAVTESKLSRTIETATSSKTADKDVTIVDSTTASVTMTLPTATSAGRVMVFKRKDASDNNVIIQRGGSDTIDGSSSFQLYHRYETITVISDGASPTNWYII